MPIEIKEMHVKINVAEAPKGGGGGGAANEQKIIEECIAQVSQMLKNTKER
ncbi:MAG: DUF5908 family protein [bacterium]|nr:DUF5908 family protein [bacterium]